MLAALLHISCHPAGETSSCSEALGQFLGSAGGRGRQVGPYPSSPKIVPAEGCTKALEGVGL